MTGDTLILRAEALVKTYGGRETLVTAVNGVDLNLTKGELVLIMGPSGSGKTTLLTLVGGLLKPDSGKIYVDGYEITARNERELTSFRRGKVGFIFQTFNLLESLSACENVQVPLNFAGIAGRKARDMAASILEELGLHDRLDYRTDKLSGGEKQRVSIARALVTNPVLLLADEPTANLDSVNGKEVMEILRNITHEQGRAAVVVSHDHRIREIADRVLWLEDGRFLELGRVAIDPTCGMQVEVEQAYPLAVGEERFYFCSRGCRREYMDTQRILQPEVD